MSSVSPHARRVSFSTQSIPRTGTPRQQPSHSAQTSEREARPRTASLGFSNQLQQPATSRDATMQTALDVLLAATALKLILFPAYRSTDFEVHRNWLAITNSLPLSKWYYDTTSEWTLDYPPFFAYFEWLLSLPASLVDKRIVDVNNLRYDAWSVIAYQRTTVIITELVLGAGLLRFVNGAKDARVQRLLSASLFLHPGFLIIDHVHFQYNGFLFGILLWSLLMARNGHNLASGILFAILLNFKHLYMYLAPAYFVYLLRAHCMTPSGTPRIPEFLALGASVASVFAFSVGPFLALGQLPQLGARLFPFTRGLNHAYWAPNAWALVTAADRIILKVSQLLHFNLVVNDAGVKSASRGLVGDTVFAVLPNVQPFHTFTITIGFQAVFLARLWREPTYPSFLRALTLCGWTSYMFGWHVHEKAILMVLVPLTLLAADNNAHLRTFILASVAGIYSLFPLLFTPAEAAVEIIYSVIWMLVVFQSLSKIAYQFPRTPLAVALDFAEKAYLFGFVGLQLFVWSFPLWAKRKGLAESVDFVPLMTISVYCAVGLVWAYLRLSASYLFGIGEAETTKEKTT